MSKHETSRIESGQHRSPRPDLRTTKGIWFAAALLFCVSQWVSGETLRLSKVVPEGTPNSERFELKQGNEHQILFVDKMAIVTGADVTSAMRSPQQINALDVRLTEQGGMKLGAATEDAHGDMRIAILIDDKVIFAPVVNAKLGRNFLVDGLKEYPDDDLDFLGWRIEGKGDEEIAKLLREREKVEKSPPPPHPRPEYYSDEEYASLKKEREKIGMYYLDQVPTEEELGKLLRVGMTREAVVGEFGAASRTQLDDTGQVTLLGYDLAPEKRSPSGKMRPDGIEVQFREGKVERWGLSRWTDAPRQAKPQGKNLRRLSAKFPGDGVADKDFGTVRWIEKVELFLQQGQHQPHAQDYADLISMIYHAAITEKESALIVANCSVVKTLAEGFPEVEDLRKTAQDGKISLLKLSDLLKPYMLGEKPFP